MAHETYLTALITIDSTQSTPLHLQVYESLRQAIVTGRLRAGTQLPSSRDLADLLQVSRNTILNALDQLIAEGYLETHARLGTFVSADLPEQFIQSKTQLTETSNPEASALRLSHHGKRLSSVQPHQSRKGNPHNIFTNGIPALDHFPFELWAKLTAKHYRYAPLQVFDETMPAAGYEPLRQAVADYLRVARSLKCDAEQIIITSGAQQGFFIAANMLLDAGDVVWMEEPGCLGPRAAFLSCGAQLVPIPVDEQGLDVTQGITLAPQARVVYVNASHHYPLGVTMSLTRRYQLLEWAQEANVWIIEDDYDSEFRYVGRPLPSLQGQDPHERVIYVGTFSKALFPGLRLGYLVVPKPFAKAFAKGRAVIDKYPHIINQMVLADFISEGHFNRHIRKMRRLYDGRRQLFLAEITTQIGDILRLGASDTGMHICGYLPANIPDRAVVIEADKRGIEVLPLSDFYIGDNPHNGIILGYTAIPEAQIASGIRLLKESIQAVIDQ